MLRVKQRLRYRAERRVSFAPCGAVRGNEKSRFTVDSRCRRIRVTVNDIFSEKQKLCFGTNSTDEDNAWKTNATGNWFRQLQSPPNVITLSRIACTPLLSYWIITNQHEAALAGCFLAGLSDGLDGYLAKHHNMATVLGTYLDPFADKLLINALSVSLWCNGTLPTPLVVLWLAKDLVLMSATYFYVAKQTQKGIAVVDPTRTPLKVQPTFTGKVSTMFQFITLGVGITLPLHAGLDETLTALCWITGGSTIASVLSYMSFSAFAASGNIQKKSNKQK